MSVFGSDAANHDHRAARELAEALVSADLILHALEERTEAEHENVRGRIGRAQVDLQIESYASARLADWIAESGPAAHRPRMTPGQIFSEVCTSHDRLEARYAEASELWLGVMQALQDQGLLDTTLASPDPALELDVIETGRKFAAAYAALAQAGEAIAESQRIVEAIGRVGDFGVGGSPGPDDLMR